MTRLCEEKTGLFPSPKDIIFTCSCPDWASMCKHVAAVLYGIGARLDRQPELLFTLRQVDQQDLIAKAASDVSKTRKGPADAKVLESDDLSEMFGIEMAPTAPSKRASASTITTKTRKPAPKRSARKRRLTLAKRRAAFGAYEKVPGPHERHRRRNGMRPNRRNRRLVEEEEGEPKSNWQREGFEFSGVL